MTGGINAQYYLYRIVFYSIVQNRIEQNRMQYRICVCCYLTTLWTDDAGVFFCY